MKIACVVGARPNFMKMAPILRAFDEHEEGRCIQTLLIHTGQHYDPNLSDVFFTELGMRKPDITLEVGSGTHATQTARLLEGMDRAISHDRAGKLDWVVVVGDVNSTLAATLAAVKMGIPVAHVEAGLRSFDRSMPEEINRIMTDSVADLLLVSEPAGVRNLLREGHPEGRIALVGNVMIDTLYRMLPAAYELDVLRPLGLRHREYGVVTLHRPANVDSPDRLRALMDVLGDIANEFPLVFPVHPRTRKAIGELGIAPIGAERIGGIRLLEPLGYLPFLALTSQSKVIVTDSGGLQEESTALGVPCLTLRENTERPITVEQGTSTLVGSDCQRLRQLLHEVMVGSYKQGSCPGLWDGKAAYRIVDKILQP